MKMRGYWASSSHLRAVDAAWWSALQLQVFGPVAVAVIEAAVPGANPVADSFPHNSSKGLHLHRSATGSILIPFGHPNWHLRIRLRRPLLQGAPLAGFEAIQCQGCVGCSGLVWQSQEKGLLPDDPWGQIQRCIWRHSFVPSGDVWASLPMTVQTMKSAMAQACLSDNKACSTSSIREGHTHSLSVALATEPVPCIAYVRPQPRTATLINSYVLRCETYAPVASHSHGRLG